MQSENTIHPRIAPETRIRLGRIVLAAIMSEAGVVVLLMLANAAYTLFGPPTSGGEQSSIGEEIGYYVAPAAGAVTTLLAALWAARPLDRRFIAHGMLVGLGSLLLAVGFIFSAQPDHRLMYIIAFVLRLLAGCAGGALAQWRFAARRAGTSRAHRKGGAA